MEILTLKYKDPIGTAIDRLREYEPPEGYYLGFSGGKDSQCIYHLAKESGVKFDAHYNLTTVDPPEVVYFIRQYYHDVIIDFPNKTMWKMVAAWGLPLRHMRYCCPELKERGGENRFAVMGIRWSESRARSGRGTLETVVNLKNKKIAASKILFNEGDDNHKMIEICATKSKRVLNPIIDWEENNVWGYLNSRNIWYNPLYNQGFKRLGCIGCPNGNTNQKLLQFKRWPKYYGAYLRATEKWLNMRHSKGLNLDMKTAKEVMNWWIYEMPKENPNQEKFYFEDMM